jgi:hypothetical protein
MKQTKPTFTPGPWSIQDNDGEMLFRILPKTKDYGVALCGDPKDAALIASAPELYEEIDSIIKSGALDKFPVIKNHALKLLAKARGES